MQRGHWGLRLTVFLLLKALLGEPYRQHLFYHRWERPVVAPAHGDIPSFYQDTEHLLSTYHVLAQYMSET